MMHLTGGDSFLSYRIMLREKLVLDGNLLAMIALLTSDQNCCRRTPKHVWLSTNQICSRMVPDRQLCKLFLRIKTIMSHAGAKQHCSRWTLNSQAIFVLEQFVLQQRHDQDAFICNACTVFTLQHTFAYDAKALTYFPSKEQKLNFNYGAAHDNQRFSYSAGIIDTPWVLLTCVSAWNIQG